MRCAGCMTAFGADLVGEPRRDRVDRLRQRLLERDRAGICRRSFGGSSRDRHRRVVTSVSGRQPASRSRSDRRTA